MKKYSQSSSYDELSKLIVMAIEDEQFFERTALIVKVKSIMKAFVININAANFNKIEKPSDTARRLRTIQELNIEKNFWKSKARALVNEKKLNELMDELDNQLNKQHL